MRQAAIGFKSKKSELEGILTTPQELPQPYPAIVVCHPHPMLSGNMDNPVVTAICRAADGQGFATLRFNFRGVGESGGDFSNGDKVHEDIKSALNVMKRWPGVDKKRISLVGYSFGAGVVLNGLKHFKQASSLVLIAPPMSSLKNPRLKKDKRAKLFMVGQNDRVTSSLELQREIDEIGGVVQFGEVANADHSLRGHEDEVAKRVAEFLEQTL